MTKVEMIKEMFEKDIKVSTQQNGLKIHSQKNKSRYSTTSSWNTWKKSNRLLLFLKFRFITLKF